MVSIGNNNTAKFCHPSCSGNPSFKNIFLWVLTGILFGLIIYIFLAIYSKTPPPYKQRPYTVDQQLVVILVPGMRSDQLEVLSQDVYGAGFHSMKENGIRVERVETVFPSLKLPACTTIQTGVYPEVHGILGNVMFDRTSNERFDWNTGENVKKETWWRKAEPIWITATKQKRRVATIEWLNADVPFQGILPEVAGGYTRSRSSFNDRIMETINYLESGFHLIMMAYYNLEVAMEDYGLYSKKVRTEMRTIGDGLDMLIQFVEKSNLKLNILFVSDRGFASACDMPPPLSPEKNATFLLMNEDPVNVDVVHVEEDNNLFMVYTTDGREQVVAKKLSGAPGYTVRTQKSLSRSLNYCSGRECPNVLVYPAPLTPDSSIVAPRSPSSFEESQSAWPIAHGGWRGRNGCERHGGVCGLDPRRSSDMNTLLLGWGNAFLGRGLVHPGIQLVDIYQIIAHLSRVRPNTHNGTWRVVGSMLGSEKPYGSDDESVREPVGPEVRNEKSYLSQRFDFTRRWETHYVKIRKRSGFSSVSPSFVTAIVGTVSNAVITAVSSVQYYALCMTSAATTLTHNSLLVTLNFFFTFL